MMSRVAMVARQYMAFRPNRILSTAAGFNESTSFVPLKPWQHGRHFFYRARGFPVWPSMVIYGAGAYWLYSYVFKTDPDHNGFSWQRELAREDDRRKITAAREHEMALEALRYKSGGSIADELAKLHDLHDKGLLTRPELDAAKAKALQI